MSLNLTFVLKLDGSAVGFPFQASTQLSEWVMQAETIDQRMALIENEVMSWTWDDDSIARLLLHTRDLMENSALKLVMQ